MPGPDEALPPLRVLHVLCDLSGGGAERLVLDLCRFGGPTVLARVATVHEGGALAGSYRDAGVVVASARRWRGSPGVVATARLARAMAGVDVVHTHLWAGDTWGRLAALCRAACHGVGWRVPAERQRALPLVSTLHNTGPELPWRRAVDDLLVRWTDRFVCVSDAVLRQARERGLPEARLRVVANGIDPARLVSAPLPEGPPWRLLAPGRLVRQKGFDVLMAAMARLPLDVELDVVGEGEERLALERAASRLGGRASIHRWQADLAPWLARCHVVVLPSRWEGFGLVAVEAMASARPVVASAVDGLAEVLGDVGVLVRPDDPGELARALTRLLADGARRTRLAAEGLARATRFDIRQTARAYEEIYRELAHRAPGE